MIVLQEAVLMCSEQCPLDETQTSVSGIETITGVNSDLSVLGLMAPTAASTGSLLRPTDLERRRQAEVSSAGPAML